MPSDQQSSPNLFRDKVNTAINSTNLRIGLHRARPQAGRKNRGKIMTNSANSNSSSEYKKKITMLKSTNGKCPSSETAKHAFQHLPGEYIGGENQQNMPIEQIRNLSPTLENG